MGRLPNFLSIALFTLCLLSCKDDKNILDTYIFIGQSNMMNWGDVEQLEPSYLDKYQKALANTYNKSVFGFNNAVGIIERTSVNSTKYLDEFGIKSQLTFDPILSFTVSHHEVSTHKLYNLKFALAGVSLYGAFHPEWTVQKAKYMPNEYSLTNDLKHNLFNKLIAEVQTSKIYFEKLGYIFNIKAVIYMGGQKDGTTPLSANTYESNLRQLILATREQLALPRLPFVIIQNNSIESPYIDLIRLSQEIVSIELPHTSLIKSVQKAPFSDFPKYPDGEHFNTLGVKSLGQACYQSILHL